jgi:hypothetical protein
MNSIKTVQIAALTLMSVCAHAQWLNIKTPGIPRTPDGKLNLAAPVPRTADGKPDLSGLWAVNGEQALVEITLGLKPDEVQPWAQMLAEQRAMNYFKDDPAAFLCLPRGPGAFYGSLPVGGGAQIIQTPELVAILYPDLAYRRIFMDGRTLPANPSPAFMGYSVGHWDGDALVVESAGFNDRTWLATGYPHTEELRLTERFHRTDFGHMNLQLTFEDPKVHARPWNVAVKALRLVDYEMLEYVCNENEKDRAHITGTTEDDRKYAVKVHSEVLAQYVGTYETRFPFPMTLNISVSNGELLFGRTPAIPLSETRFSFAGQHWTFVKDDRGRVTHISLDTPEGEARLVRKE